MGFLRRHRSLFFPTSNEATAASSSPAAGPSAPSRSNSTAAASLDVPPSPSEAKLRRRKSFFEVLGFGKKSRAAKRQSLSAGLGRPAQRPRSATVGDMQKTESGGGVPPVPPLPAAHRKPAQVSAVQLDDLELDDDHMAAVTAVVNNTARDEPPAHLFLHVPHGGAEAAGGGAGGGGGKRASVASKRASTVSTRSTAGAGPQAEGFVNGQRTRRASLRNSLLTVKDLPDLPGGRPLTPTRARPAPPSAYAPPPESIAQRLESASVTPEPGSPVQDTFSSIATPTKAAPAEPAPSANVESAPESAPQTAHGAPSVVIDPTPADSDAGVTTNTDREEPIEAAPIIAKQPPQVEEPAPEPVENKQTPAEAVTSPSTAPEKEDDAPVPLEAETEPHTAITPAAEASDVPSPAPAETTDAPTPAPVEDRPPALPVINTVSDSSLDIDAVPEIPDEPTTARSASPEPTPAVEPNMASTAVQWSEPGAEPSECPLARSAQPLLATLVKGSAAQDEPAEPAAVVVQTPDEEVPEHTWSSSSHPSTPSMLPHTPVGTDELRAALGLADSPPLSPQRTGSPVAVKQRNVSAPLTPLVREPSVKGPRAMPPRAARGGASAASPSPASPSESDAGPKEAGERGAGSGGEEETPRAALAAAALGKGHPVSHRYTQLRSVSLPPQRRLSAPPKTPPQDEASLDDFVGLMKQVISREKGMSIRDAARAAEQRKSSVPI